ncbi:DUF1439 domain-containing protein [Orbus sturtevantii]|uniref:DUF1439 domain-containing protein n=1 Tax=Orbus sturtevantii TaxID=3074109 RepID=UPI00370D9A17
MMRLKQLSLFMALLLLAGLLSACQQIGQYSLSEQALNSALQKKLAEYSQSIDASNMLKMKLDFNKLNLNIGQQQANQVAANGTAQLSIQTPLATENVSIKLHLNALPEINKQQDAIYLKQVEIADYQIDSRLGSISSGMLLPYLNQALQLYFEHNPIYQLDQSNQLERLAFKSVSNIRVEQGKLVFSML